MAKRKSIMLSLQKEEIEMFKTPVGSPDVVVGLLSTLAVPGNEKLRLVIDLQEIDIPDEKENH